MDIALTSKNSRKKQPPFSIDKWLAYLRNTRLETYICIAIFSGIIFCNKAFTHINYRQLYIVETLMAISLVIIFCRYAAANRLSVIIESVLIRKLYPLCILLGVAITSLAVSLDNGFLALKQSFILFYGFFVIVFIASFYDQQLLRQFLLCSLVVFSFVIIAKLTVNLITGNTYAHETWRVVHDEVDVIFASLALLALFLWRNEFCEKNVFLYAVLLVINLGILALTMKRTAFIGLFPALMYCAFQMRWFASFKLKHLTYVGIGLATLFAFSFLFTNLFSQIEQIIRSKLDVLNEGNSAWRIMAWEQAIAKFQENPFFGSGYGHRILDASLWTVDTMDPHNSYLAILVYNGLLGFIVLMSLVTLAFYNYKKILASSPDIRDRKLIIWCTACLIFMVVFPCFNVTLENQRQGIFFWFFIAASFFLDPKIASIIAIDTASVKKFRRFAPGFSGATLLLLYVGLVLSPGNFIPAHDIYNPKNNGQNPILEKHDQETQLFTANENGLTLILKGVATEKYAYLMWVITGEFIDSFDRQNSDYVIEITFGEKIERDIIFHFNKRMGGHVTMENITPATNKFTVPIDKTVNHKALDIYSMSLIVPHRMDNRLLNIKAIKIVAR